MLRFGNSSMTKLSTCHIDLQTVCQLAISKGIIDFSVICGHRTEEEQDKLYPRYTKVKYPDSKHNSYPSQGVDLYPYHPVYKSITGHPSQLKLIAKKEYGDKPLEVGMALAEGFVKMQYGIMLGVIQASAKELGVKIRAGYDWDADRDSFDHSFIDMPHIELV